MTDDHWFLSQNLRPQWLVRAKVTPPVQIAGLLERPHLLSALNAAREKRITLIEAPPGFGKTSLLAQWRTHLTDSNYHVAWLTLESTDSFDVFAGHLGFAVEQLGVMLPKEFWSGLYSASIDEIRFSFRYLLHCIENENTEFLFIIDDVEATTDEQIYEQLGWLIRAVPRNLHIALSSRPNSALTFSDLLLQGRVNVITADDLRFTQSEVHSILAPVLTKREILEVYEKSEGWPAAIQIARFLVEKNNNSRVIQYYSGKNDILHDYVSEQIIPFISDSVYEFLLDISILAWITPDAVDFIRETTDSEETIGSLSSLQFIITKVDFDGKTHRMHALLKDYFSSILQDRFPERYKALHGRAALWMAKNGRLSTALSHAAHSENNKLLGEILENAGGLRILMKGGMARLRHVDTFLTEDILDVFPRLALLRCVVRARDGQLKSAKTIYEDVQNTTDRFSKDRPGGDSTELFLDQIIAQSMLTVYGCLPMTYDLLDRQARETLPISHHDHEMFVGHHKTWLCLSNHQAARFPAAERYGEEALRHYDACGSVYGKIFINFHLGATAFARGESKAALEFYDEARRWHRSHFPRDKDMKLVSNILLAELHNEQNASMAFSQYLRHVDVESCNSGLWFDIYAAVYTTVAEFLAHNQGTVSAAMFLDKARSHAEEVGLDKLHTFLNILRINIYSMGGDLEKAEELMGEVFLGPISKIDGHIEGWTWREADLYACTAMRLFNRLGQHREALDVSEKFGPMFRRLGLVKCLLQVHVLAAVAAWGAGQASQSVSHLSNAISLARGTGYTQEFVRNRSLIISMLERLANEEGSKRLGRKDLEFVQNIWNNLKEQQTNEEMPRIFTQRENEIMKHLSEGFQDKVIARKLGITEHGVRYHLKNIYRKIGAANRGEAVARARSLKTL